MADLLESLEIETAPNPDAAVVWMHGLGADGHDFEPIVPELRLPATTRIRFVFPHAPLRPVTINQGHVMRAWYDVRALAGVRREDEAGVRQSARQIEALLARERQRGIAPRRIVIAGFSQGGAMALHVGLRYADRLAGLLALSCYLPLSNTLPTEASPANRDVPIFWAHGLHDPMIPQAMAEQGRAQLGELGYQIDWHQYPIPHSVSAEE
ncbi:MAG TPA: alpha/beta fold hydrolase, partial [Candidatus Udaeobacter sp.]|nr:alpha/beta fold hydrolase [Candidatus Udaeobacter sp.]